MTYHPARERRGSPTPRTIVDRVSRPACVLVVLLSAFAALPQPGSSQSQQGDAAASSTLEGVYTEDQAERGGETFENVCSACHSEGEFRGPIWSITWSGRSAGDFLELIANTMPLDRPSSLSRQEYADVVAYVLQLNGYPPGDAELPSDADAAHGVRIDPPPDTRR